MLPFSPEQLLNVFLQYNRTVWPMQAFLFAFGLAVAGLIRVRKPSSEMVGRAITTLLSLLWLWAGIIYHGLFLIPLTPAGYVFAGLFVLQAALFVREALLGRLRFEVQKRPRAAFGGILMGYGLVIYPLLGLLLDRPFQTTPTFGTPCPTDIFTLGVLCFATSGLARSLLILPIVWAAVGSMVAFGLGMRQDLGLLAAGLIGIMIAIKPHGASRQLDPNIWRIEAYRRSYRLHRAVYSYRWVWAADLVLGIVLWLAAAAGGAGRVLWIVSLALIALSVISGMLWLFLGAWHSILYRSLAWRISSMAGQLRRWLATRAGWGFVVVGAAFLLIQWLPLPEEMAERAKFYKELASTAFAIVVLLGAIHALYRARRRIVILAFENHTGNSKLDAYGPGAAAQLRNELARMRDLYANVDEVSPQQAGMIETPVVGVQDIGSIFEKAVGPGSIKIGFLQIPVSALFGLVSSLAQGPRITGSLHQDSDGFFLIAQVAGGGLTGSWRVGELDLKGFDAPARQEEDKEGGGGKEERFLVIHQLVVQLTCRIFAGLVSVGSPRWQAIYHFTRSLRAYREIKRTHQDWAARVREVERELLLALNQDQSFVQCHYNLGILYREMGQLDSAETSFRRALEAGSVASDAAYALGEVRYYQNNLPSAIRHGNNAIDFQPENARAWNLVAVARSSIESYDGTPHLEESSVEEMEIATALAWRELCRTVVRERPEALQKQKDLVALCTCNLAAFHAQEELSGLARRLYWQALLVAQDRSRISFELGEMCYREGDWQGARSAFSRIYEGALEDDDRLQLGLHLFGACSALTRDLPESEEVRHYLDNSYNYFLDVALISGADLKSMGSVIDQIRDGVPGGAKEPRFLRLKALCAALDRLPRRENESEAEWASRLRSLRKDLTPLLPPAGRETPAQSRERLARSYRHWVGVCGAEPGAGREGEELGPTWEHLVGWEEDWKWFHAQVVLTLAKLTLSKPPALLSGGGYEADVRKLRKLLSQALEELEPRHDLQVRQQALHQLAAQLYLLDVPSGMTKPDLRNALIHALRAVRLDPEDAWGRVVLGRVYAGLGDWHQAQDEWDKCLRVGERLDSEVLIQIASCYVQSLEPGQAPWLPEYAKRVTEFLQKGLEIVESASFDCQEPDQWIKPHAWMHYSLGRIYCHLGASRKGIPHLRIARSLGCETLQVQLTLAKAYLAIKDLDESERIFQEARKEIKALEETPTCDRSVIERSTSELSLGLAALSSERSLSLSRTALLTPPGSTQPPN